MKVYYINLETRPDKREFIEDQLINLKVNQERVPGVVYSLTELKDDYVTASVKGCAEAHQLIYKKHADSEEQYCLILEDDATLLDEMKIKKILEEFRKKEIILHFDCLQIGYATGSKLTYVIQSLKDNFRIIETFLLNWLVPYFEKICDTELSNKARVVRAKKVKIAQNLISGNKLISDSFLPGTHGYIISKNFAAKVSKLNIPIFLSADLFLMSVSRMCSFKMYRLKRNLIEQNLSLESDIGSNRFKLYRRLEE